MKDKISKIIILILTIILMYVIIDTYAAYKTLIQENVISSISPWVVFVNGENIASTQQKTFEIEEVIKENENVAKNKLAPGIIVELPIEIDATQTQNMDIRYDIIIDELKENQPNFKIKSIIEQNYNAKIIKTDTEMFTGIITSEEIAESKKHKLLVSVIWENDENYNELDTALGTSEERQLLNIPVTVFVSQYGGEEIPEGNV